MRQLLMCLVLAVTCATGTGANATSTALFSHTVAGKALHPKINSRIQSLGLPLEAATTNRHLHRKLKDYLNGGRSTERMLGRALDYFPIFEASLCTYDVPEDLKYLAVTESMLHSTARSPIGAVGLWQFMPATAREYGLRVDYLIDERLDVRKSSDAAARMLRDLYADFGDWHLVVAAYNAGAARVRRDVRRSGGVPNFVRVRSYLPRETRNYVAGFIAAAYTLNYFEAHGLEANTQASTGEVLSTVTLHQRFTLGAIARATGLNKRQLYSLNPSLRSGIIPATESGYALRLPLHAKDSMLMVLWGRTNLIQNSSFDELRLATRLAEVDGLNLTNWLLGCNQLVNQYEQSPLFLNEAGRIAQRYLRERPTLAAA